MNCGQGMRQMPVAAMARVVRETPRISASSEPNATTAAPTRTTGPSQSVPASAARATSDSGAVAMVPFGVTVSIVICRSLRARARAPKNDKSLVRFTGLAR